MLAVNRKQVQKAVPQKAQKNPKHDKIEQLNILDKCTQILKDDRLILRNMLKEGNQEIDAIILKHKKNTDWLSLQTDLRKYLNKLKGKHLQSVNSTRSQSRPAKENSEISQSHINLKKDAGQNSYSQERKPLVNTQERQNNFFQLKVNQSPQVNQQSPVQQVQTTALQANQGSQKTSHFNITAQGQLTREEQQGQKSPQFHEVNEEEQKVVANKQYSKPGNNMLFGQYNYNIQKVIEEQQEEQRDSSYQGSNTYSHFQTQQNENYDENLVCVENLEGHANQQGVILQQNQDCDQKESAIDPPHSQNQLATEPDVRENTVLQDKQQNGQDQYDQEEYEQEQQLSVRQSFDNAQNPQILGQNSEALENCSESKPVINNQNCEEEIVSLSKRQQLQQLNQPTEEAVQEERQQGVDNFGLNTHEQQQQDDDDECNVDNLCLTLEQEQQQQQTQPNYQEVHCGVPQDEDDEGVQQQVEEPTNEAQQFISQTNFEENVATNAEDQELQETRPCIIRHLLSFNRTVSLEECQSPVTPVDQPINIAKKHMNSPLKQRIEEVYEKEDELNESGKRIYEFNMGPQSGDKNLNPDYEIQAQQLDQLMQQQRQKNINSKSTQSLKNQDQFQPVEQNNDGLQQQQPLTQQPDFTQVNIQVPPREVFTFSQQFVNTSQPQNVQTQQSTQDTSTLKFDPNNILGMKLTNIELELLSSLKNTTNPPQQSQAVQNQSQQGVYPGAVSAFATQDTVQQGQQNLSNSGAHQQAKSNLTQPLVSGTTTQFNANPTLGFDWKPTITTVTTSIQQQPTSTTIQSTTQTNTTPAPQTFNFGFQPQTFAFNTTTGLANNLTTVPRSSFYGEQVISPAQSTFTNPLFQNTFTSNPLLGNVPTTTFGTSYLPTFDTTSISSSFINKQQQQSNTARPAQFSSSVVDTSFTPKVITPLQLPVTKTEVDPIKAQYKDLFTSPELLQQCRADIQSYNFNKKLNIPFSTNGVKDSSNNFLNVTTNVDNLIKQSQTLQQSPSNLKQSQSRGSQYRNNPLESTKPQGSGVKQNQYDVERVYQHLFTNWDLLLGANKSGRKSVTKRSQIKQEQQSINQFVVEPVQLKFDNNELKVQNVTTSVQYQQQPTTQQQPPVQQRQEVPLIKVSQPLPEVQVVPTVYTENTQVNTKAPYSVDTTSQNFAQLHLDDFLGACSNTIYQSNNVNANENNEGRLVDEKIQNIKESLVHQISSTYDLHGGQLSLSPKENVQQQQIKKKTDNAANQDYIQLISSTDARILSQKCDFPAQVIDQVREKLYLHQITAEDLFDEIFTDSSLAKISKAFFRFKLETIVLELSNEKCQVKNEDIDTFFELCDLKKDGFLDVNELGPAAKVFCQEKDIQENVVQRVFDILDTEQKGYLTRQDLEETLTTLQSEVQVDPEDSINPSILVKELFDEVDSHKKGFLTYWDIYLCKNTYQFKRIINLFESN